MKEIKFRAWDNVKDRMLFIGEENDIMFYPEDTGFEAVDLNYEEGEADYYLSHLQYMQYIGLEDKNKTKIYEDDILLIRNGVSEYAEEFQARVKYLASSFGLVEPNAENTIISETIPYFIHHTGIVIGNIYEDPNLIR